MSRRAKVTDQWLDAVEIAMKEHRNYSLKTWGLTLVDEVRLLRARNDELQEEVRKLRLIARENKWYADRHGEQVDELARQLKEA